MGWGVGTEHAGHLCVTNARLRPRAVLRRRRNGRLPCPTPACRRAADQPVLCNQAREAAWYGARCCDRDESSLQTGRNGTRETQFRLRVPMCVPSLLLGTAHEAQWRMDSLRCMQLVPEQVQATGHVCSHSSASESCPVLADVASCRCSAFVCSAQTGRLLAKASPTIYIGSTRFHD